MRDQLDAALDAAGENGLTAEELAGLMGWAQRRATSLLSDAAARAGAVRLELKRGRFSVYVTPMYRMGRDVAATVSPGRAYAVQMDPDADAAAGDPRRPAGGPVPQPPAMTWQEGYDRGIVDGRADMKATMTREVERAYERGRVDGSKAGPDQQTAIAEAVERGRLIGVNQALGLILGVQRAMAPDHPAVGHRKECWRDHPRCALGLAMVHIRRNTGVA